MMAPLRNQLSSPRCQKSSIQTSQTGCSRACTKPERQISAWTQIVVPDNVRGEEVRRADERIISGERQHLYLNNRLEGCAHKKAPALRWAGAFLPMKFCWVNHPLYFEGHVAFE